MFSSNKKFIEIERNEEYILEESTEHQGLFLAYGLRRGLGDNNGRWVAEIPVREKLQGIIYDMEKITFISRNGIEFLARAVASARNRNRFFGLYRINSKIEEELKESRIGPFFPIYKDLESAVKAYASSKKKHNIFRRK